MKKPFIYIILVALCLAAFGNSLTGSFVSDDILAIQENPQVADIHRFLFLPHMLLNALIYRAFGFNPIPYHAASILLHSLNTILVFIFLSIFFNRRQSLIGACIFAVHPVHAEAVAWISGRPYQFTALFTLLCLLLYQRATAPLIAGKKLDLSRYGASLALFLYYLAFNYSFFFAFPLLLILLDVSFERWRKTYRLWTPFILASILRLAFVTKEVAQRIDFVITEGGASAIALDPLKYLLHSLAGHFKLLIWPQTLTLYHDAPFRSFIHTGENILLCGIIAGLFILAFKKSRRLFFGMGLFVISLIPTFSPLPLSNPVAERYVYFATIALSILCALLWKQVETKFPSHKRTAYVIMAVLLLALTSRTLIRNEDWRSQENLWVTTAKLAPNNPRALHNMGASYLVKGKLKEAEEAFKKTIQLAPYFADAYNNLGVTYRRMNDVPGAIRCFTQAIRLNSRFADAYNNLGIAFRQAHEIPRAIEAFSKAIEVNPQSPKAYFNLADVLDSLGKTHDAITLYERGMQLTNVPKEIMERLVRLYMKADETTNAIALLQRLVAMDPRDGRSYLALAVCHLKQKEYPLAKSYYTKARALGAPIPPSLQEAFE
jgi:tetratricopeptide (TPR) repeat protein